MKITSARSRASASDGRGSKVWEFVPSGTMPVMSARSPITAAAMEVIGATVVTTESRAEPSAPAGSSVTSSPHPAPTSARAAARAATRRGDDRVTDG